MQIGIFGNNGDIIIFENLEILFEQRVVLVDFLLKVFWIRVFPEYFALRNRREFLLDRESNRVWIRAVSICDELLNAFFPQEFLDLMQMILDFILDRFEWFVEQAWHGFIEPLDFDFNFFRDIFFLHEILIGFPVHVDYHFETGRRKWADVIAFALIDLHDILASLFERSHLPHDLIHASHKRILNRLESLIEIQFRLHDRALNDGIDLIRRVVSLWFLNAVSLQFLSDVVSLTRFAHECLDVNQRLRMIFVYAWTLSTNCPLSLPTYWAQANHQDLTIVVAACYGRVLNQ